MQKPLPTCCVSLNTEQRNAALRATVFYLRSASEKINHKGKEAAEEKPPGRKQKRQGQDKGKEAVGGKGQGWGATLQHVNLFSDAEREAGKLLGQNADHQREKKEQELQTQQRSGLAPTALGEGSAELKDKDCQPWYTQVQPLPTVPDIAARTIRLGREVTGKEAEEAIKRDHGRKSRADPMGSLFRSRAHAPGLEGPIWQSTATAVELCDSASVELNRAATQRNGTQRPRKGKRVKKDKRGKKEKKRKGSTKERRRSSERDNTTNGGVSSAGADDSRGHTGEAADAERQQSLVRTALFLAETSALTAVEGVENLYFRGRRMCSRCSVRCILHVDFAARLCGHLAFFTTMRCRFHPIPVLPGISCRTTERASQPPVSSGRR